ncbi:MAG: hypothetical protein ABSA86_14130 [Oryzomonas sp.]
MKTVLPLIIVLLTTAAEASAGGRSVTFFSDGAVMELEAVAVKGIAEIPLPAGTLGGTLRIRPERGTRIQRVDTLPPRPDTKGEKELDALIDQRGRLEDRLRAVATREEIFTAAAKSQSGKAPRKTKTNPDPLQSIRQGTDFALAQLETVYAARRKTEQEIRRIDVRIASAHTGGKNAGGVARVAVSPGNGRVTARFAVSVPGWTPWYDIRIDNTGGSALVTLFGHVPVFFDGYQLRLSPASLAGAAAESPTVPAAAGQRARLAEYRMSVGEERFGNGPLPSFAFMLKNTTGAHLPAGEAAFFRAGEYWGTVRFTGMSSGRSSMISSGR